SLQMNSLDKGYRRRKDPMDWVGTDGLRYPGRFCAADTRSPSTNRREPANLRLELFRHIPAPYFGEYQIRHSLRWRVLTHLCATVIRNCAVVPIVLFRHTT